MLVVVNLGAEQKQVIFFSKVSLPIITQSRDVVPKSAAIWSDVPWGVTGRTGTTKVHCVVVCVCVHMIIRAWSFWMFWICFRFSSIAFVITLLSMFCKHYQRYHSQIFALKFPVKFLWQSENTELNSKALDNSIHDCSALSSLRTRESLRLCVYVCVNVHLPAFVHTCAPHVIWLCDVVFHPCAKTH